MAMSTVDSSAPAGATFPLPAAYHIRSDNAFLPASVRMITTIGAARRRRRPNAQPCRSARIWDDIGPQLGTVNRDTYRLGRGFNWQLGGSWHLDGYYQYGQTDYSQRGYNTTVNAA